MSEMTTHEIIAALDSKRTLTQEDKAAIIARIKALEEMRKHLEKFQQQAQYNAEGIGTRMMASHVVAQRLVLILDTVREVRE